MLTYISHEMIRTKKKVAAFSLYKVGHEQRKKMIKIILK